MFHKRGEKEFALLVGLLLLAATVFAFNKQYSSGVNGISVSQTAQVITFINNHSGGDSVQFSATWIKISSRSGGNACFYDPDGAATTADHRLAASEVVNLNFIPSTDNQVGWSSIGVICDTGESATWDISAGR